MNNYLRLLWLGILLGGCGTNNLEKPNHEKHQPSTEAGSPASEKKWSADSSTYFNVNNLFAGIHDYKTNPAPALEKYSEITRSLQSGLNKLIKECRMKGPDHDALHDWLEPLLEMVKSMDTLSPPQNIDLQVEGIENQVNRFYERFEL